MIKTVLISAFLSLGTLGVAIADPLSADRLACKAPSENLSSTQKLADSVNQACQAVATAELENCTPPPSGEEIKASAAASAAGLTDVDILARLIFSESLSTGYWDKKCNSPSVDAMMASIAWGVVSRVPETQLSAPSAYYRVIFRPAQFGTSFSAPANKKNPYAAAFLCPLKETVSQPDSASTLFTEAQDIANQVIQQVQKSGIPSQYQGITNFFYPQSEFYGSERPNWAPNKNPSLNKGFMPILGSANPCVEFYNLNKK